MAIDVPQGSTCGLTLFLLYINDLFWGLVSIQTVHFADDMTLYRKFKTFRDISDEVEIDIGRLQRQVYMLDMETFMNKFFNLVHFEFFITWQHIPWVQYEKFTSHTSLIVGAYLEAHLGTYRSLLPWCLRGFMACPWLVDSSHDHFVLKIISYQVYHMYPTRFKSDSNSKLNLPLFFKAKWKASFIYRGMAQWNRIPGQIGDSDSVKSFRKKLKNQIISISFYSSI